VEGNTQQQQLKPLLRGSGTGSD